MAGKIADTLKIDFIATGRQFDSLADSMTPKDAEELALRLDRWMFGKKGSLATSIKQQSRDTESWKPLSKKYVDWKAQMRKSKRPIPGEPPPNTVISEKIWIRTGKVRQFTEKTGNGPFKQLRIFPHNLLKGRAFYEVFGKNIEYWQYPNAARKLMFFTAEDKANMQNIFGEWVKSLVIRRLRGKAGAAA